MSVGLLLEGGGTRGAYTSGVLDVIMEEKLEFPVVYGVSAGACNAVSYLTGQIGRNYEIFYNYIRDERYLSVTSLYQTGSIFGFDFIFGELFHKLVPLDYDKFFSSPVRLRVPSGKMQSRPPSFRIFSAVRMPEMSASPREMGKVPMLRSTARRKAFSNSSFLAMKQTLRGERAMMQAVSIIFKWLHTSMAGPSEGMFPRPRLRSRK